MAEKKQNTDNVKKDIAEIKLLLAVLQKQIKDLEISVVHDGMYTKDDFREIAAMRNNRG
jgi:hypothetical protein